MIITADWVLPVNAPPIEQGAIAVREGCVVEVGRAADVCSRWLSDPVEDFPGCIIGPGLVNAHTHLALSVAVGLAPPGPLHPWLAQVTKIVLGLSHEEFGHSARAGALECLRSGTTSVGDVVYGAESLHAATSVGLGGAFFWEVLGITPADMAESLARRGYPGAEEVGRLSAHAPTVDHAMQGTSAPASLDPSRVRYGLSPHAPYSCGPDLLRATAALARRRSEPFAIHVSEAAAEVDLMECGIGPFKVQADRLATGFSVPGMTPVAYLDSLGVLKGATCIHAVHVTADDVELLSRKARAVVLCPRSNAYLDNGAPPVAALRHAGAALAIGTDSSASNSDLNLFTEAQTVREIDPDIGADALLEAVTLGGAVALGLEGRGGEIAPGASADMVVVEASAGSGQLAAEAFLQAGALGRVNAVMGGGSWLVRNGSFTFDTAASDAAAAAARAHAVELLSGNGQASPN